MIRGIAMAALVVLVASGASAARVPTWATAVLPSGHEYLLEVAADDASRARGYMGREVVGPREGMIFVYFESGRWSFWMRNCKVALDMIWLDESFRVVHIAENRTPCPEEGPCPTWSPLVPARYILEFAAGTAKAEGLRPGSSVVIVSDPPLR